MRQLLASHQRDSVRRLLLLAGLAATAACSDRRDQASAMDSSLARDLTLAGSASPAVSIGDTAVAAPAAPTRQAAPPTQQKSNTKAPPKPVVAQRAVSRPTPRPERTTSRAPAPAAPAPVATAPVPEAVASAPAPAPAPARGSIGSGTLLSGTTSAAICSLANRPGDRFVVSLANRVVGSNGAVLEAGTPVLIELASVGATPAEGFDFRLRGVQVAGEFVPAEGRVSVGDATITERSVSGGNDKGKVVTGVIAGAILGRVLGGGAKGAVIGAAGGAAAGTVAAQRSRVSERCMAPGAPISVTLSAPLVLPASAP